MHDHHLIEICHAANGFSPVAEQAEQTHVESASVILLLDTHCDDCLR
jgi:hypothetical protein